MYEREAFAQASARAGIVAPGSFVPHPPANALLLAPLAGLRPRAARAAWGAVLLLAWGGAFLILGRSREGLHWSWRAVAFLVPTAALANAVAYGQPYPLLALLLALAFALLERGRAFAAGLCLAPVLILKLYALPFLLRFLLTRRGLAAAGLGAGAVILTGACLLLLGPKVHLAYLREVLPASLQGRIQDPYSPVWGSLTSLVLRLFAYEPDLNPEPALDRPALAAVLGAALPVFVMSLVLLARAPGSAAEGRRDWALVCFAALAASPLTATYHFVLLAVPAALLLGGLAPPGRVALLALVAFATSILPHSFLPLARGWSNLLAYPRLAAVLVLVLWAGAPLLSPARVAVALLPALLAGAAARPPPDAGWTRVREAGGYLAAAPAPCAGVLHWLSVDGDGWLAVGPSGRRRLSGPFLRCVDGALVTHPRALAAAPGALPGDADRLGDVEVWVEPPEDPDRLREWRGGVTRTLVAGRVRGPRLSPDASRVAYQVWRDGSWNVEVVSRATLEIVPLTRHPANEVEPAWLSESVVVFASDQGRGLGSTALYVTSLPPGR